MQGVLRDSQNAQPLLASPPNPKNYRISLVVRVWDICHECFSFTQDYLPISQKLWDFDVRYVNQVPPAPKKGPTFSGLGCKPREMAPIMQPLSTGGRPGTYFSSLVGRPPGSLFSINAY